MLYDELAQRLLQQAHLHISELLATGGEDEVPKELNDALSQRFRDKLAAEGLNQVCYGTVVDGHQAERLLFETKIVVDGNGSLLSRNIIQDPAASTQILNGRTPL